MKKSLLKKYALYGMAAGLVALSYLEGKTSSDSSEGSDKDDSYNPNEENEGYYLLSEEELLIYLNRKGRETYESLNPEGKKLALKVASRRCNNMNECKGLNACRTENNDCAGQGSCKGTTKCAISDKNLAVKLVAKHLAEMKNKSNKE